ncbi:MAG: molecular chaperone TorD family protein [Deltaproteobacteria bacterium]|nr:molecular chaperone TorD family protein [Deltaproteobacteria bacterium]
MVELIYLYKILSLGFSYPDEKTWALLEKHMSMFPGLSEGETLTRLARFKECFMENRRRLDNLRSEYLSLFDVGREISPYETEYMREKVSRKPFELADIAGFYTAFGFAVHENMQNKEALDHITIELEFMAILAWKEAYATERNQDENAKIVQDARIKFFKEHLGQWGFFFSKRIAEQADDGFFNRLAWLLERTLNLECRRYSLDASFFDKELNKDPYEGVRGESLIC